MLSKVMSATVFKGTYSRKCEIDILSRKAEWSDELSSCRCERRSTVNYFKLRVSDSHVFYSIFYPCTAKKYSHNNENLYSIDIII